MYKILTWTLLALIFNLGALHASHSIGEDDHELKGAVKSKRTFQLPEAQVIRQALSGYGLEYFLEKTELPARIEKKKLTEQGISTAVILAFTDYGQYLAKAGLSAHLVNASMDSIMLYKQHMIDSIMKASSLVKEN